jgi:hypothetical protein
VAAGLAAALLVALFAWLLVPVHDDATGVASGELGGGSTPSAGATAGAPAAGSPGATVGAPSGGSTGGGAAGGSVAAATSSGGSGAVGGGVAASGTSSGADRCAALRATDQGIAASEIFVAVPVLKLVGEFGNQTFGVRGNIAEIVEAVTKAINANGGVACRKLRIKTYDVNPISTEDQRSKCLQIIGDKPFAVIDISGYPTLQSRQCFFDAKLPFQGSQTLNETQAKQVYPYAYSARLSAQGVVRNWVQESSARGTFKPENGFKKLGLIRDECDPEIGRYFLDQLASAGVTSDKISLLTIRGCSAQSPNDVAQAVIQHRNAGASHVLLTAQPSDMQNYVRQADGLGYKPQYLVSDIGTLTAPALQAQWPDGFNNAISVTATRTGERNSGIVSPYVAQCNDWMKKGGVAPAETENDQIPGLACEMFRLFVAAANNVAPNGLNRQTLVDEGLPKVGTFGASINSDGIFNRRGKVTGGDQIRAIQWHLDCKCWKVIDRDMKPAR